MLELVDCGEIFVIGPDFSLNELIVLLLIAFFFFFNTNFWLFCLWRVSRTISVPFEMVENIPLDWLWDIFLALEGCPYHTMNQKFLMLIRKLLLISISKFPPWQFTTPLSIKLILKHLSLSSGSIVLKFSPCFLGHNLEGFGHRLKRGMS